MVKHNAKLNTEAHLNRNVDHPLNGLFLLKYLSNSFYEWKLRKRLDQLPIKIAFNRLDAKIAHYEFLSTKKWL